MCRAGTTLDLPSSNKQLSTHIWAIWRFSELLASCDRDLICSPYKRLQSVGVCTASHNDTFLHCFRCDCTAATKLEGPRAPREATFPMDIAVATDLQRKALRTLRAACCTFRARRGVGPAVRGVR